MANAIVTDGFGLQWLALNGVPDLEALQREARSQQLDVFARGEVFWILHAEDAQEAHPTGPFVYEPLAWLEVHRILGI